MSNLISRFSLISSVFFVSLMLSACAKDFTFPLGDEDTSTASPPAEIAPVAKKPEVQVTGPLNAVAQAAQKAGVADCLGRINQVSSFLTAGSEQNGASLSIAPQAANEHMTSIAFEIRSPQVLSYASADFAPVAGGCGATYEAVTHWQNSCKDVATKGYAQLKSIGVIQKNILVLEGSPQLRVFLMPAGKGCVAIKKEVVY